MAKNYTITEAVEIIAKGTDFEAIADIGRRFPILAVKTAAVAAKAGESFVDFMSFMPEHLTANKVNTLMKNSIGVEEIENDDEDSDVEEKTAKKAEKKAAKSEDSGSGSDDYESMSGKELYDILGKAGKRKDCKEKMGGLKKEHMVEYINKYGLEEDVTDAEDEDVEESSENPYEGIAAPELFKECKKRGIKAAPKKPAKYYVELLMKSDEEVGNEPETEEDDWGDDAEEPKTEKKAAKKEETKSAKKAKAEEEDEDDDWDI